MFCINTQATHLNKNEPTTAKPIALQNSIQFEENKNQLPKQVKFSAPLFRGGKVYFEDNAFTYLFWDAEAIEHLHHPSHDENSSQSRALPNQVVDHFSYKAQFLNANQQVKVEGSLKENFFRNYLSLILIN
jgi:hypothetical protein